jgi:hypothetical protein
MAALRSVEQVVDRLEDNNDSCPEHAEHRNHDDGDDGEDQGIFHQRLSIPARQASPDKGEDLKRLEKDSHVQREERVTPNLLHRENLNNEELKSETDFSVERGLGEWNFPSL